MKRRILFFSGMLAIWGSAVACGGYRHLKQDMDAYLPPLGTQSSTANVSRDAATQDTFEKEKAAIEAVYERWAAIVQRRILPADSAPMTEAADEDTQTLAILRDRFSLEDVRQLILLRNFSIKAAAGRLQAALEGFSQVEHLDAILRRYSAYTEGVMAGVGPMRGGGDSITMKFPFPGMAALRGQVAEKNVQAQLYAFEIVQRDVVAQGSKVYWNLLYTHRALRITRDMLDRLDHLASVATTRYGAGKTSYQDVARIRIGLEKLREELTTLNRQRVNLETELLALLGLLPGHLLGRPRAATPEPSLPKLESLYPLAMENRQELNRMRAMVGKMERMAAMAETMIQPGYSQNYSLFADAAVLQAGSIGMKPSFDTSVSPTWGKGLPKNAWFGSRDAYLRETRRKLAALRADLADAETRTRLMVRTGWFEVDRARRERDLFKYRLLQLAKTSLDVSTRGYESGKVSFADVIASYTGWLEVNLASERRNSDLGIAWVELERRIGTRLPPQPENTAPAGTGEAGAGPAKASPPAPSL